MNHRRLVALGGVAAFVLVVAAVAVVANRGGTGPSSTLPKLTYQAGQSTDAGAARSALAPAFAVTYEVRGTLPKLDTTAPAYRVDVDASRTRIDRLASALGVPADHVQVDPTGKSTPAAAPALVVSQGSWTLMEVGPDCSVSSDGVTTCSSTGVGTATAGAASVAGAPADCPMPPCPEGQACAQVCPGKEGPVSVAPPQPAPPPARPADLPSRDEAERIGRDVLAKAGIALADADVRVDDQFASWAVTASPRLDGLATQGIETTVSIGPKGAIVGGSGSLVTFTKIGDYPLAGTTVGLERLRAGRFTGPVPMAAGAAATTAAGSGSGASSGSGGSGGATVEPSPPVSSPPVSSTPVSPAPAPAPDAKQPLPEPSQPEPLPPREQKVVITGVHVALARSFGSLQDQKLLPVYVFETEPATGGIGPLPLFPVPAVTDALLATDTQPPIKP